MAKHDFKRRPTYEGTQDNLWIRAAQTCCSKEETTCSVSGERVAVVGGRSQCNPSRRESKFADLKK